MSRGRKDERIRNIVVVAVVVGVVVVVAVAVAVGVVVAVVVGVVVVVVVVVAVVVGVGVGVVVGVAVVMSDGWKTLVRTMVQKSEHPKTKMLRRMMDDWICENIQCRTDYRNVTREQIVAEIEVELKNR